MRLLLVNETRLASLAGYSLFKGWENLRASFANVDLGVCLLLRTQDHQHPRSRPRAAGVCPSRHQVRGDGWDPSGLQSYTLSDRHVFWKVGGNQRTSKRKEDVQMNKVMLERLC